ncbi:TonB-dependent receptor [Microbulbifer hainanensis]|uniref:TonB-dependent receptor n=1 Tax=Microbulbifer hainanensis TaxID=2735675 RepID=UPI001866B217|nr:TonB-dependent receptor [Microbulbifer hainanensis]
MIDNKRRTLSLVIGALVMASQAVAQDTDIEESKVASDSTAATAVEEVEVTGIRSSIKSSLDIKRDSINVVDSIVAEDIGKFPDQNIAEALQRMSGVTITRNAGEGQKVTVRGLGGDYNVTTINGRRMASEDSSRNFNFDLIASELLKGVEVYKSPVAKTQEGGIGSVINIQTRRPMDFPGLVAQASVKGIYEDRTKDTNPQASFLVSDTFLDGKFGALLTGVYSERTLRTDGYYGSGFYNEGAEDWMTVRQDMDGDGEFDPAVDNEYGTVIPGYVQFRNWQDTRKRIGANLALQWRPRDDVEVNFDGIYSSYDTNGEESQASFVTYDEWWTPGVPSVGDLQFNKDGLVNALTLTDGAMVEILNTTTPRNTQTYQVGTNVAWDVSDNFRVAMDVSHSEAESRNTGDNRYVVVRGFVDQVRIDASNSNYLPDVTMTPALSYDSPFGAHYSWNSGSTIKDAVSEFRLDADWAPQHGLFNSVKFGLNLGDHGKDRITYASTNPSMFSNGGYYFQSYPDFTPDLSTVQTISGLQFFRLPADVMQAPRFDNFLDGESSKLPAPWPSFDYNKLMAYYEGISPEGAALVRATYQPTQSFDVGESTLAAYIQGDMETSLLDRPLIANFGVRVIQTSVDSSGYSLDPGEVKLESDPSAGVKVVGTLADYQHKMDFDDSYVDALPSMNLKWNLTDELVYRLDLAKVITRPSIDSLQAYGYLDLNKFQLHTSNPGLEPMRANQLDTSLEWYFSDYGALTSTLFFKDINSFTEYGRNGTRTIDGYDFDVYSSVNGDKGAMVRGAELTYQQSLSNILPAPLDGFGVQVNYTYVDSEYDDPERRKAGLPFVGMPQNSYNAVVYYEKDGAQARLAYNWRGKVLVNPEDWGGPSWNSAYGQLDFSADYDVTDNYNISLSVTNLTNERNWGYVMRSNQVSHLERYGRTINLGASAHF